MSVYKRCISILLLSLVLLGTCTTLAKAADSQQFSSIIPSPGTVTTSSGGDRPQQSFTLTTIPELESMLNTAWGKLFTTIYALLAFLAINNILGAGVGYIMASGDVKKTEIAKTTITQTFLALLLLGASYAMIFLIYSLLYGAASLLAK